MADNSLFAKKLPPQNLEAEQGVIGSILLENELIDEVADMLQPAHFYNDRNQRIFGAISRLHEQGIRGIDAVTLREELQKRNEFEEAGSNAYLLEVLESVPHAAHCKYYAEIVRDRWVQRTLTHACNDILAECYEGDKDTEDVLASAEQRIFSILDQQEAGAKISLGEILIDAFDRIQERMATEGTISGVSTGFQDLDKQLNGLQPTELIILAARPSMGKTALVCNIAEQVGAQQLGVLLFSLEQSKIELAERLLCIRARVNGHRLRAGDLDEAERDQLIQASSELNEFPIFIDDKPGRTMAQIGAIARRLKRRKKLDIIIVDYLQLIEPEEKQAPREQQIAAISRRLKFLAKELSVPVVALAQLNRGVELREDKRPRLADLRESGAIEQDADVVMFLHRPDAYDPEDRPGEADVIVAKNRNGPTGFVTLTWLKDSMRFGDFSNVNEPEGGYFGGDGGF